MADQPRTRYAKNGDVHIAYQVVGEGDLDILLIDTWVHHVEAVWDFPDFARFLRRLSSLGRLIHFDRRGTGLSDSVPLDQLPDFQMQVDDAVAVLEAAGSDRPAVIGLNDGTIVASMLAAQRSERCRALVLFTFAASHSLAAGMPMESIDEVIAVIEASALTDDSGVELLAPSRIGVERFDRHLARSWAQVSTFSIGASRSSRARRGRGGSTRSGVEAAVPPGASNVSAVPCRVSANDGDVLAEQARRGQGPAPDRGAPVRARQRLG